MDKIRGIFREMAAKGLKWLACGFGLAENPSTPHRITNFPGVSMPFTSLAKPSFRAIILSAAVAALLLAGMAPSQAAGELKWFGGGDELNAELRYSDAEKTDIRLSFWCTPDVDIVYVAYEFRPANATEGMEAEFTLSAGGIDIAVGAIGYQILMDKSFVLEGQIPFNETFVELISATGTLTATAENQVVTFPLEGARAAAEPLLEMCSRSL